MCVCLLKVVVTPDLTRLVRIVNLSGLTPARLVFFLTCVSATSFTYLHPAGNRRPTTVGD